jgi:hypothetical protein
LGSLVGRLQLAATFPVCADLVFLLLAMCQSICFIAELLYRWAKRDDSYRELEELQHTQRTLKFWLRDSSRICVFYVAAGVIGDIPMGVSYLAAVRGWPLHWWWSSAVTSCLLLMLALAWLLERFPGRTRLRGL